MKTPIPPINLNDLSLALDSLIEFLKTAGIDPIRSRLNNYRSQLKELIDSPDQDCIIYDTIKAAAYTGLISELVALAEIHRSLRNNQSTVFLTKLQEAIKGPTILADENPKNSSNHARNTLFELTIAARIQRGGLIPEFENPTDLASDFPEGKLFIECKRPQGISQLNSRLRDGTEKILAAKKSCPVNSAGFVAIYAGKALFEGHKVIITDEPSHLPDICEELCDKFISAHKERIRSSFRKGLDGLILDMTFPAWIPNKMQIIPCSYMSFRVNPSFPKHMASSLQSCFGKAMQ